MQAWLTERLKDLVVELVPEHSCIFLAFPKSSPLFLCCTSTSVHLLLCTPSMAGSQELATCSQYKLLEQGFRSSYFGGSHEFHWLGPLCCLCLRIVVVDSALYIPSLRPETGWARKAINTIHNDVTYTVQRSCCDKTLRICVEFNNQQRTND